MWETINNTLNGSLQTLVFIFLVIIVIVILIKNNYLKIRTNHINIGVDEKERAILRQQTEWTYQYVSGLYGIIIKKYPELDKFKTKYILELIYDEIVIWIMFNHITRSEMYLMVKQEKLHGIVFNKDINDVLRSEEFEKMMNDWTKEIINRLIDIREYYNKK